MSYLDVDEIFRIRPDRPWEPPCLLYNGCRVSFPEVKWPERGVNHTPPSSTEEEARVELYFYYLSGCSCCYGVNLTSTIPTIGYYVIHITIVVVKLTIK
jgi:hypothetical protein